MTNLPEPYCQDPERYRVLSNGAIYDNEIKRISAGAGSVAVSPDKDTRITSDISSPLNGTKLAHRKHELTREKTREAIVAAAIKGGAIDHTKGASDVIALGVATIWSESLRSTNKLGDRIKAQQHVIRVADPGLLLDERQRDPGVLPGGMRIDISEETARQLFGTLKGVVGDIVEGDVIEHVEPDS